MADEVLCVKWRDSASKTLLELMMRIDLFEVTSLGEDGERKMRIFGCWLGVDLMAISD